MALRNTDFTPTRLSAPQPECGAFGRLPSGGGPVFLRVLREEILPFVDTHYRTNLDRGIIGHSHGGTFALFALFEVPDLFRRVGALSPSLWWDKEIMLQYESKLARAQRQINAHVFVSVGGSEIPCALEPTQRLVDSLRAHRYTSLDLRTVIFPDEDHTSVVPAAISRALHALGYDPPPVPVRRQ
jgi:predicted alpha/beta superfamily hydrolase